VTTPDLTVAEQFAEAAEEECVMTHEIAVMGDEREIVVKPLSLTTEQAQPHGK
jgi:hypothetical protein